MKLPLCALGVISCVAIQAQIINVDNPNLKVKYKGFARNAVEVFLNIKYGDDTGGQNRFKPPRAFKPAPNTVIDATNAGPACPQRIGGWYPPIILEPIPSISEDCLNLNLVRPAHTSAKSKLPVMIWIHGGGFFSGSNTNSANQPDGLIQESVQNGLPIIHISINYRLGVFGFAQSAALRQAGSENAGLRDQRLAIEWVRDNIASFGGDPTKITIYGQSSGGLSVGMQLLAYGGTKPLPFQQGICESQALEPGITGSYTIDAMTAVSNYLGCNTTDIHSQDTIHCLRTFDTYTLFNASAATRTSANVGDIWLPSVDGDFLPAPPSQLIREGRFADAETYMMGWTEGDMNLYTPYTIATPEEVAEFFTDYMPRVPEALVTKLLDLYPIDEFTPPAGTNLTAQFYRTGRIFRDIVMVCEPLFFAEGIRNKSLRGSTSYRPESQGKHASPNNVYLYNFNQTLFEPFFEKFDNVSHIGVVHTSDSPYNFGNLSAWNINDWPWEPSAQDYELAKRTSRSWGAFVATGRPSLVGKETLQGWGPAYGYQDDEEGEGEREKEKIGLYVVGGPSQGLSYIGGEGAVDVVARQRLEERCALINSDEFIKGLQF